jgi:hypothetical protein
MTRSLMAWWNRLGPAVPVSMVLTLCLRVGSAVGCALARLARLSLSPGLSRMPPGAQFG